jgi:hypothetical protein
VLSLALCVACGGKAEKDGPVVEGPSAGGSGAVTASGGSGGASVTPTTGGAVATTGGVLAAGGVVAAGGQTTSTGGAPPRPEPGTELWFSRGYLVLSANAYWDLLTELFSLDVPTPFGRRAWGPLIFSVAVPRAGDADPSNMPAQVLAEVSDEQLLETIDCSEADAQCAELAATRFARRLWRRDVTPEESDALMQSFSSATPGTERVALRALVQSILEAPDAYALPVLGTEVSPGKYELSELELAGLLAISVTGQPPDEALLDAAAQGAVDLDAELDRLLEGDEARRHLALLIHQWFSLRGARELWIYEDEPALADSMVEETRLFIENVVFDEPAPVSSLATAPFSFIDGRLAELYGLDSPSGESFQRVELGDTRRRGIPGQASFLTSTSFAESPSYVQRGVAPLQLICENLPPPPPDVVQEPPPPAPGSRRSRYETMTSAPVCASCHGVMNPLAFSFEHFDERGAFIEIDPSGFAVDSSGELTTFFGSRFEFEDSADLMDQLSKTPQYSECFVRNAVGWLVGLGNGDPAVLDYVARGHDPGDDEQVLAAIRTFVNSDHFRYRKRRTTLEE